MLTRDFQLHEPGRTQPIAAQPQSRTSSWLLLQESELGMGMSVNERPTPDAPPPAPFCTSIPTNPMPGTIKFGHVSQRLDAELPGCSLAVASSCAGRTRAPLTASTVMTVQFEGSKQQARRVPPEPHSMQILALPLSAQLTTSGLEGVGFVPVSVQPIAQRIRNAIPTVCTASVNGLNEGICVLPLTLSCEMATQTSVPAIHSF